MRFLPEEFADITASLRSVGVDEHALLFVKRKGRLHIQLPGRSDSFAFFRQRTTVLDQQGRWAERTAYYLGHDKVHAMQWPDVLRAFEHWVQHPDAA